MIIRQIIRCREKAVVRTPSGLLFNAIDQSQYVNLILLLKGTRAEFSWEPNGSRLLVNLVRPDDRIVVAGANIGFETILIGNRLKSGKGICYAFEPIESNYRILRENILLNNLEKKILPFPIAIGDNDAEGMMMAAGPNSSLLFVHEDANYQRVSQRRLDTLWIEGKIEPISGMVADVEGYEWEVIAGAERLLSVSPIRFIIFEVNGKTEEVEPGKITKLLIFLRERGFQLLAIPDDYRGYLKPSKYPKKLITIKDPNNPFVLPDRWFNVLAVQKEILSELSNILTL